MKKIVLIFGLLGLLASCSKEMYDYSGTGNAYEMKAGEGYMRALAQELAPDCLIALESALAYDHYGYYEYATSEYQTGGKSLRAEGSTWTVNSYRQMKGVKISCIDSTSWKINYSGDYALQGYEYPTVMEATAVLLDTANADQFSWKISFEGSRVERDGYACSFKSNPSLTFSNHNSSYFGWGQCNGAAVMLVTKNSATVDICRMEYLGNESRYFRGK